MKPRSHRIHPDVDHDYEQLLEGGERIKDSIGRGWEMVHDVWLRNGLPIGDGLENRQTDEPEINGFRLIVIDEFDCTFLFGWRATDQLLVLFAMSEIRRSWSATRVIAEYRDRIENFI